MMMRYLDKSGQDFFFHSRALDESLRFLHLLKTNEQSVRYVTHTHVCSCVGYEIERKKSLSQNGEIRSVWSIGLEFIMLRGLDTLEIFLLLTKFSHLAIKIIFKFILGSSNPFSISYHYVRDPFLLIAQEKYNLFFIFLNDDSFVECFYENFLLLIHHLSLSLSPPLEFTHFSFLELEHFMRNWFISSEELLSTCNTSITHQMMSYETYQNFCIFLSLQA